MHASALIKKRHFQLKGVPRVALDKKLENASIGKTTTIKGRLDEVPYHLFAMKDKDYIIKLMTTHESLNVLDSQDNLVQFMQSDRNTRQQITFK